MHAPTSVQNPIKKLRQIYLKSSEIRTPENLLHALTSVQNPAKNDAKSTINRTKFEHRKIDYTLFTSVQNRVKNNAKSAENQREPQIENTGHVKIAKIKQKYCKFLF